MVPTGTGREVGMGSASGDGPAPGHRARTPSRRRGARDTVRTVLHRGIVAGTIPGGTRLVQSRIAEELGVGTAAVRDALTELAACGLVRSGPDGVAVVHELSRAELEDLYEIRKLLEPVATARAARHADRQSILKAVELLAAMECETDSQRWAQYNDSFHSVIEEAGSGPRLVAILNNLRDLSALYVTHSIVAEPGRMLNGRAEHEEILRAFIARDPEAAADAMFRHLDGRLRTLLTVHEVGDPCQSRASAG
jgi:DNA-binding GntR family transcriptional regulator